MRQHSIWAAVTLAGLLATGGAAAQDENPTTPGAIPNPGTYQGSMQLQQQSDRQDQQFRQQQQQTFNPPSYPSGNSSSGRRQAGAPASNGPAPEPPRRDSGQSQEAATPESRAAEAANNRRDYVEAMRILRVLDARGSAQAAYNIGMYYEDGLGVAANKTEAAAWFLKAADRGMGLAMGNLAVLIGQRPETAENLVQAYKWFTLAIGHVPEAQRGVALSNREIIARRMTRADIDRALTLARAWDAAHSAAAHYLKPESPAPAGPANALLMINSSIAGPGWMTPMPGALFWVMRENPTPILATYGSAPTPLDQLAADCRTPSTCSRDFKAVTAKAIGSFKTDATGRGQLAVAAGRYYVLGAGAYHGKPVFWFRQVDVKPPQGGMSLDQTDGLVMP
jgi:hypothetical protein